MLEEIITITDRVRLASLIAVLGSLGAVYALLTGQITYPEFAASLAAINAGAGVLGVARNGAGHGTSESPRPEPKVVWGEVGAEPKSARGKIGHVRVGEDDAA